MKKIKLNSEKSVSSIRLIDNYEIENERKQTPCKFNDGISYKEFFFLAYETKNQIDRIEEINCNGATVCCTVLSKTGLSKWSFNLDFNDWGHITGKYWLSSENFDSLIPSCFANELSKKINLLISKKSLPTLSFSYFVERNKSSNFPFDLSYCEKPSIFKRIFFSKKRIVSSYDSTFFIGEHIFPVLSLLIDAGYKDIKSVAKKDINQRSDNYPFEVEQITINGASFFQVNDVFPDNAKVVITYHAKEEIKIPNKISAYKKRHYSSVISDLLNIGFFNIHEEKLKDLVTGLLIKNGSVNEVLIRTQDSFVPIEKSKSYEFDSEIIVSYHSFK